MEFKALMDKNKSVPSKNDNIIKSTHLELSDNSKEPEEIWSPRTSLEITLSML